jgi:hypothetical protein
MLQFKVEAEQKFFGVLAKQITQKAVHFLAIAVRANIHVITANNTVNSVICKGAENPGIAPYFRNKGTMAV